MFVGAASSRDCFDKEFFLFTIQPINDSTNQLSLQDETSTIVFKSLRLLIN
jgi:hypothetical protein